MLDAGGGREGQQPSGGKGPPMAQGKVLAASGKGLAVPTTVSGPTSSILHLVTIFFLFPQNNSSCYPSRK